MFGALGPLPVPAVHYTCTHCEVGWAAEMGNACWYCEQPSAVMENIIIWWMKQYSQPVWRARADTHTTEEGVSI